MAPAGVVVPCPSTATGDAIGKAAVPAARRRRVRRGSFMASSPGVTSIAMSRYRSRAARRFEATGAGASCGIAGLGVGAADTGVARDLSGADAGPRPGLGALAGGRKRAGEVDRTADQVRSARDLRAARARAAPARAWAVQVAGGGDGGLRGRLRAAAGRAGRAVCGAE